MSRLLDAQRMQCDATPVAKELHVDARACALKLTRIINGKPVHYTHGLFHGDAFSGCNTMLKRAYVLGDLGFCDDSNFHAWVDVLNRDGEIIQSWPAGRRSFAYIRRKLGLGVISSASS